MTRVRNSSRREKRKTVISEKEFNRILKNAALIDDEYFRLRALAVLSLLRFTGKRRNEVAVIPLCFVKVENGFLNITFELEKKKKRKKICPGCETINSKTSKFCKKCGFIIELVTPTSKGKPQTSTKSMPLSDPLTAHIVDYYNLIKEMIPNAKYLFPSAKNVFGNYVIIANKPLSGRSIFNIIRGVSEEVWPHLFRETAASDVIKQDPTIIGAFKVMTRLDLESYKTGFNYLKRYASDVITREKTN